MSVIVAVAGSYNTVFDGLVPAPKRMPWLVACELCDCEALDKWDARST